jgi:hypothetical protein
MKLDPAAREKKYAEPSVVGGDRPLYPWGLTVTLDREALEALGLVDNLPKVGSTMKLEARVDVVSVSENESTDGKNCSVSLQITELGLAPVKDDDAGDRLYDTRKRG